MENESTFALHRDALTEAESSIFVMFTYTRARVSVIPPKCVKSIKTRKVEEGLPDLSLTKSKPRCGGGTGAIHSRDADGKRDHEHDRA